MLDVKLDPRILIYWVVLKTLSLVCYVYVHSLTCMCSYVLVFLCVTWLTNFAVHTVHIHAFITLNTHDFQTETTGKTLWKEAWKIGDFQQTENLLL